MMNMVYWLIERHQPLVNYLVRHESFPEVISRESSTKIQLKKISCCCYNSKVKPYSLRLHMTPSKPTSHVFPTQF